MKCDVDALIIDLKPKTVFNNCVLAFCCDVTVSRRITKEGVSLLFDMLDISGVSEAIKSWGGGQMGQLSWGGGQVGGPNWG